MRSIAMPRRSPHTESLEIEQASGTGEGHAVVGADRERQASLTEQSFGGRAGEGFAGRLQSFAQEQETRGMVCDGQRVAVPPVAELELAFEVGAPQVIGHGALGQRRAARAVARPAATLDQAVAIENRMDGALGRYSDIAAEPPDQELANLTRAPVRLLGLQPDNQALNLLRQLVGVA